jgi:hypothetical protein
MWIYEVCEFKNLKMYIKVNSVSSDWILIKFILTDSSHFEELGDSNFIFVGLIFNAQL